MPSNANASLAAFTQPSFVIYPKRKLIAGIKETTMYMKSYNSAVLNWGVLKNAFVCWLLKFLSSQNTSKC